MNQERRAQPGLLSLRRIRFDLGISSLIPEWRRMFRRASIGADVAAGLTVACIAVPLSLAIALASGVSPAAGLTTAIVAGVVGALFGGSRLSVTGPAAAMAVLVSSVVERHGVAGLLVVTLGCGVLQLLTGVLGLGRLVRFVPVPVIAGFTAGIGVIILIGQLPRALGLPPPAESHVFDVILHIGDYLHEMKPAAFVLAISTAAITIFLPRAHRRLPAPLIAVVATTAAVALLGVEVPTVGDIPRTLPPPSLPSLSGIADAGGLVTEMFIVFALASLETLLSTTAVDKMTGGQRHDADQELIGQGLANVAASLFGGIPVTGVIARSSLNVQAGARTRLSALIHALTLMGAVYLFASIIGRIPLAVLAGVLLAVAMRMVNPAEFRQILRTSRSEAAVYGVTLLVIVVGDLIAGVQVGLVLAFLIAALRMGQVQARVHRHQDGRSRLQLKGPLTFLSTSSLDPLRDAMAHEGAPRHLTIDLGEVTMIDVTGASLLLEVCTQVESRGTKVVLVGLSPKMEKVLASIEKNGFFAARIARSEAEVDRISETPPMERLARGVDRFQGEMMDRYRSLFEALAVTQAPHTLFITCSDSRIVPVMITSSDPGELFVVRNVGNIVPPSGGDDTPAEGAAVEFAVGVLGVSEIVVCGHSECGAMKAILHGVPPEMPSLHRWLENARDVRLSRHPSPEEAAKLNVLLQLEHLLGYPVVREKLGRGELRLHAWYYDIASGKLLQWSDEAADWTPITGEAAHSVTEHGNARPR